MIRCKVTREPTHDGHHWLVETPHGDWDNYNTFDTFQEAIQFADQMARTIEITLPRDKHVWETGRDSDGRLYVETRWGNEICYYPNGDEDGEGTLKDIALALLAHHYTHVKNRA